MGNKRITRKDVAKEADVSETIVSYVINGQRYVDKEKKKRVQEAIEKLNYVPNSSARALKGKKTDHILLLADNINIEYSAELLNNLINQDIEGQFIFSLSKVKKDDLFVSRILTSSIDGIVLDSPCLDRYLIDILKSSKIPLVVILNTDKKPEDGVAYINAGTFDAVYNAIELLEENKCKEILFIDSQDKKSEFDSFRISAFRAYESTKGNELRKRIINIGTDSREFYKLIYEELSNYKYDAIITSNDQISVVTKIVCENLGYVLPRDIKLICFDNTYLSNLFNITSIEIDIENIAKRIISILKRGKDATIKKECYKFRTKIIERESTKNIN